MRIILRTLAICFLLLSCTVEAQKPPYKTKPAKISHEPPVVSQELFVPYWTLEPSWHTELEIRNNRGGPALTVTPVVRMSSGNEITLASVELKPNEIKSVDIAAEVERVKPNIVGKSGSFGSIVLRFQSQNAANIYAAAMVGMMGSPVAYHFDAIGNDRGIAEGDYEGLWWLPTPGSTAYFILTNSSSEPVEPELSWFGADGNGKEKLQALGPRQTRRIEIREIAQRMKVKSLYGGLRLRVTNGAGSLQLSHIIFDPSAGFSAIIRVHPHNPIGKVKTYTLRAPMMALSTPDPVLTFPQGTTLQSRVYVRNATQQSMPVEMNVNWRSDSATGVVAVPITDLSPEETRIIDLSRLQESGLIPKAANWAGVHLTYQGKLGDLVATGSAFSQDYRYGAQSPFRATMTGIWRGGMWKVDDTHNSLITAGNGGKDPLTLAVAFTSKDGSFRYDMPDRLLQPGEQIWVDVARLIRTQVADKNGKTLPQTMTAGSYQIEDVKHPPVGYVYEGKLILDKTYGHVGYGCMQCCGYSSAYQDFDPLDFAPGDANSQQAMATNSCTNGVENFTNYAYGWNSSNTSAATVDSGGTAEAVADGFASVSGYFNANSFFVLADPCPEDQQYTSSSVTVTTPDHIEVEVDSTITLSCTGNPKFRTVQYAVLDASDTRILSSVFVREQLQNKTSNSCGPTPSTTETCTRPTGLGVIVDGLSAGCLTNGGTPNPCGWSSTQQQWQWCAPNGSHPSIGTPGALQVNNTSISIGGNTTGMTPGYQPPK